MIPQPGRRAGGVPESIKTSESTGRSTHQIVIVLKSSVLVTSSTEATVSW
jgi:hypothetical protein